MIELKMELIRISKELKNLAKQTVEIANQLYHNPLAREDKSVRHIKPKIGRRFSKKFRGRLYRMTAVKSNNEIGYKVGRKIYKSPSAAARSITKYEVNGWVFWNIKDSEN